MDPFSPGIRAGWDDAPARADASPSPQDGARAARRARGKVRRYIVVNRLTRLWTLTYGGQGQHDRDTVIADVQAFTRALRARWAGIAYVYVLELHPGGHGWHVHLAVGRFLPKRVVAAMWGHGFVDARRFGGGGREQARGVARYLGKYLVKAFEEAQLEGHHRYEVAQGHQPVGRAVVGYSARSVWTELVRAMGGEQPAYEWESASDDEWRGPPVGFLSW